MGNSLMEGSKGIISVKGGGFWLIGTVGLMTFSSLPYFSLEKRKRGVSKGMNLPAGKPFFFFISYG